MTTDTKLAEGVAAATTKKEGTSDMISKGVVPAEGWRFVEASDPGLIEALDKARATYDAEEPGWQERAVDFQLAKNIPPPAGDVTARQGPARSGGRGR